jgi:hypothetical protein
MFKDVLNHMAGAADFASIGLLIFFAVFVITSIRVLLCKPDDVKSWSLLPLDDADREVKS